MGSRMASLRLGLPYRHGCRDWRVDCDGDLSFGSRFVWSRSYGDFSGLPFCRKRIFILAGSTPGCFFGSVFEAHQKSEMTTMTPNKSTEPTAVGACRSAVAVHVVSSAVAQLSTLGTGGLTPRWDR